MTPSPDRSATRERAVARLLASQGIAAPEGQGGTASAPEDAAAFARARQAWDDLGSLRDDPDYAALLGRPTWRERLGRFLPRPAPPRCRRRFAPIAAGMAGIAACAAALLLGQAGMPQGTPYATHTAETRRLALADGSTIALGAESRLEVAYTEKRRFVAMAPGEAFFDVSKDPGRPFVIQAGDTRITVLGTRFNVKYDETGVRVAVVEGRVQLTTPRPILPILDRPAALVRAGQQARVAAEASDRIVIAALTTPRLAAWMDGQLHYDDVPLGEIVSDLNRYLPGEVEIASPVLAEARLTTAFSAGQAGQFLASLPQILPLRLEQRPDGRTILTETPK